MKGCGSQAIAGRWTVAVRLCLIMLCWVFPGGIALAQAPDPGITVILPADQPPAQVEALIKSLKDTNRPITIKMESASPAAAETKPEAAPPGTEGPSVAPVSVLPWLTWIRNRFMTGLGLGFDGIGRIDTIPAKFAEAWRSSGEGAGAIIGLLVLLLAISATYFSVLSGGQRLVRFPVAADLIARFCWRLRMVMMRFAALLAMFAVGVLVIRFLGETGFVADFAHGLMRFAFIIGLYVAIGRFLLAPDPHGSALLPVERGPWHLRNIFIYATAIAIIIESINLLVRIGTERVAIMGWLLIVTTAAGCFALWWIWNASHDIRHAIRSANPDGLGRRYVAALFPAANIIGVLMVWSAARMSAAAPDGEDWSTAASVLLLLIAAVPILGFGIPALIDALMGRHLDDQPVTPARAAGRAMARTLAGAGTWIAVIYAIIYIWSVYVAGGDPQDALQRMRIMAQAGLALLIGCVIWVFFKSYFDSYAPKTSVSLLGGEEEGSATAHGRLHTVLPLIRDIVLGGIISLTALVILSAIGVNIGPLLAGFGVVGLAISFGSQTLIKDIVSGIFFMVDDAFRVGEYIETGRQKGTVEKIHLRSVQLRHQNGQIHTIPFGQLDAITNYSRDWATVKFEIRLDRDADIEAARKTIKKVGLAMQEDPEFGPDLIAPLKMQGIQEITDSAVVVRLKFTAKPKNPSLLQREALRRVYRALQEAGVLLASSAVVFRSPGQTGMAGAAASVTTKQPAAAVPSSG